MRMCCCFCPEALSQQYAAPCSVQDFEAMQAMILRHHAHSQTLAANNAVPLLLFWFADPNPTTTSISVLGNHAVSDDAAHPGVPLFGKPHGGLTFTFSNMSHCMPHCGV